MGCHFLPLILEFVRLQRSSLRCFNYWRELLPNFYTETLINAEYRIIGIILEMSSWPVIVVSPSNTSVLADINNDFDFKFSISIDFTIQYRSISIGKHLCRYWSRSVSTLIAVEKHHFSLREIYCFSKRNYIYFTDDFSFRKVILITSRILIYYVSCFLVFIYSGKISHLSSARFESAT